MCRSPSDVLMFVQLLLVMLIMIVGIVAVHPLRDMNNYTAEVNKGIVNEFVQTLENGFYCHAILQPFTKTGQNISLSTYRGGTSQNRALFATPEVVLKMTDGMVDLRYGIDAVTLSSDECKLLITDGMILDGESGRKMPLDCGESEITTWWGNHSRENGGLKVVPIITGLLLWGILRCLICVLDIMVADDEGRIRFWRGLWEWYSFRIVIKIISYCVKVAATVLLVPVSSMTFSDQCPQLVVTMYNEDGYAVLSYSLVVLLIFWGYNQYKLIPDKKRSILQFCSPSCYSFSILLCIIWFIVAVVWLWRMTGLSWTFILGFSHDLSLMWPDYGRARELQAIRVIMLLLTMLDIVQLVVKICNPSSILPCYIPHWEKENSGTSAPTSTTSGTNPKNAKEMSGTTATEPRG